MSSASEACPYVYLVIVVKWKGKEQRLDQVLELALMTNYSFDMDCCQLIVSICIDSILSSNEPNLSY